MVLSPLPNPIVHYQFGCDNRGQIEVVESGPLMKTLSAHHKNPPLCHLSSNGMVSTSTLQSNATIQELQEVSVDAEAFAIELWMTPILPPKQNPTTTSIGDSTMDHSSLPMFLFRDPNENNDGDMADECTGFEVALAQRGLQLELRYVDHIGTQNICRVLMVRQRDLVPYTLQQVVVVWRNGETNLYLDGVPVVQGAPNDFDTTLSLWNPLSTLQLFGTLDTSEKSSNFGGSLNMLSIYNQVLTDQDVNELYLQGAAILELARAHRDPLRIQVADGPHVQLLAQGGHTSSIHVGEGLAFDASNSTASQGWSLMLEMISLPFFGSLFPSEHHQEDTNRLDEQQRLLLDVSNTPLTIWYRPNSEEFFNAPSFSFNGTSLDPHREFFTYRFLVLSKGSEVLISQEEDELVFAMSDIRKQELIVIHVNHRPVLNVPEQATVYKNQPTGVGARPRALLSNVQVLDMADFNIDRIRVDLWVNSGTLTIANDYLPLADFGSCRASERQALLGMDAVSWSCHGNGIANRNMTFLATPDNASQILTHVEYHGFHWDQADEVVIRLSDGVDGSCLSQKEHRLVPYQSPFHKYHTIHNDECFQVQANIPIPPIPSGDDAAVSSAGGYMKALFDVDDFGLADGIFWGFVLLATTACCVSIRACIRCCGARGAKIHIEDAPMEDTRVVVVAHPRHEEGNSLALV